MKVLKNIFFICSAVLILLPGIISFSHIFSEHSHKLCDNYAEHHYHSKSLDCDLHKFSKKSVYHFTATEYLLVSEITEVKEIFDYYSFLNEFEPLHFDLRGPPQFA
ncbi:hypothetical protein G3I01_14050 [Gramella sp. MT6]|uniref:hypothetical protein n=1 Tax=Gramella sp. MT6 TaxID=2705471 RepID=UPI001C5DF13C|nr:hypothetical protein [Gramella sp. MT6]QYA26577.1 hypothetical protein G3I01_14050 [Gramella sp. MT6]